jgi:aminoglycoside 2''-phosphotransferase
MYTKQHYLKRITEEFSKVRFSRASFITNGWDDIVLILDDATVFAFPKDPNEKNHSLQKELRILPLLNTHIHSLKIPNFKYISHDKTFAGYNFLKGIFLSGNLFKSLNEKEKDKVAKQLATFLKELHSFPVAVAKKNGVGLAMRQKDAFVWLKSHIQVIKKKLSKDEQKILEDLENPNFSFTPVVAHQDFGKSNILFDPQKRRLTGIIDFGDIQIADPAGDFARLWFYGEKFIDMIIHYYNSPDKGIKERSRYYSFVSDIHLMYYGVKKKRKDCWIGGYKTFKKFKKYYAYI